MADSCHRATFAARHHHPDTFARAFPMSRMPSPTPAAANRPLHDGASVYGQVLLGAGGLELEAMSRRDDRAGLCVALYRSPAYDLQVPALGVSRLSINLTTATVSGALDGDRVRRFQALRHSLFLTPAGAAAHWKKEAPSRHLNIYFHPKAFADEASAAGQAPLGLTPLLNGTLPFVRRVADELAAELESDDVLAAEAVDCLARLLLMRLARRHLIERGSASPLSLRLLGRVQEFVEANLAERILVSDLAAVAGLSPGRFAHAYTELTGQAPHQFVLARRLARAVALVRGSRLGLAEIAAQCGFASQQHMTHTMRRKLGFTPGRYRAGLR